MNEEELAAPQPILVWCIMTITNNDIVRSLLNSSMFDLYPGTKVLVQDRKVCFKVPGIRTGNRLGTILIDYVDGVALVDYSDVSAWDEAWFKSGVERRGRLLAMAQHALCSNLLPAIKNAL